MDEKEFFCLFPDIAEFNAKEAKRLLSSHNVKPSVYTEFTAKRNASRIDHYFINAVYKFKRVMGIVIFTVVIAMTLFFFIIETNKILKDNLQIRFLTMLFSVQLRVVTSVESIMSEANFFSRYLANLFSGDYPITELNRENAKSVVKLIDVCRAISSDRAFWWDIGVDEGGQLFGIESFMGMKFPVILVNYGYTVSRNESGYLYTTTCKIEGEIPDDFPDSYDYVESYNLFTQTWYKAALSQNTSVWTDPFLIDPSYNRSDVLLSITTPMFKGPDASGVVGNTFSVDHLKNVVSNLTPTKNSRLVIIDDDGNVIAMNSRDRSMEVWNDTVVMKDVTSIDDEVWDEATLNPSFFEKKNFQFSCDIEGEKMSFIFATHTIDIKANKTWTLLSAICSSDYLSKINSTKIVSFAVSLVFVMLSWSITAIFLFVNSKRFSYIQNQIMSEPNKEQHGQMLSQTFKQCMQKIVRSHSYNKKIVEYVKAIIKISRNSPTNNFYTPQKILMRIERTMREIIKSKFGIQESTEFSNIRIYKILSADSTFSSVSTSEKKNVYTGNFFRGADLIIEPTVRTIRTSPDAQISFIVDVFTRTNSDLLFDKPLLEEVITKYLNTMSPEVLSLAADSFDFVFYVLSNKLPNVLTSVDTSLSLFIALLIWHLSMRNRINEESPISRYIVPNEYDRYIIGDDVFTDLEESRIKEVVYDTKRWSSLVETTTNFLHGFPLKKQLYTIRIFEKITRAREGTLLVNEEIILLQVILSLAEYSFVFHKAKDARKFSLLINHGSVDEEIGNFEHCIINEIIQPGILSLKSVMDTAFLEEMVEI